MGLPESTFDISMGKDSDNRPTEKRADQRRAKAEKAVKDAIKKAASANERTVVVTGVRRLSALQSLRGLRNKNLDHSATVGPVSPGKEVSAKGGYDETLDVAVGTGSDQPDEIAGLRRRYRRPDERPRPDLPANAPLNRTRPQVAVTLPPELVRELTEEASRRGVKRSELIEKAIRRMLEGQ